LAELSRARSQTASLPRVRDAFFDLIYGPSLSASISPPFSTGPLVARSRSQPPTLQLVLDFLDFHSSTSQAPVNTPLLCTFISHAWPLFPCGLWTQFCFAKGQGRPGNRIELNTFLPSDLSSLPVYGPPTDRVERGKPSRRLSFLALPQPHRPTRSSSSSSRRVAFSPPNR